MLKVKQTFMNVIDRIKPPTQCQSSGRPGRGDGLRSTELL
jgi:hypothetical protein